MAAAVSSTSYVPPESTQERAGSSRPSSIKPNVAAEATTNKHKKVRGTPSQPALLRLDPSHPLIPSLTSYSSGDGNDVHHNLKQQRAKKLGRLHVALQTGLADDVWSAYLDLRHNHSTRGIYSSSYKAVSDSTLTAKECRSVVNVISNDAARTKRGVNRILRLMSDVRDQQHRLLAQLQHAYDTNDSARSRLLKAELEAWDSVVSAELLNSTVTHIGKSLRSVGLEEIDQVLDQLLTYEANEQSRKSATAHESTAFKPVSTVYAAGALDNLRTAILSPVVQSALSKKRGKLRPPDFPDLSTYNTILDIITRTITRSSTPRRSATDRAQAYDEEEEDVMSKFTEQQRDSHSAELDASISMKLRRFDLDADAASLHADAFERADRLFHSVLERMQRKSRIEPDAITFNIMVTMYCLLDRWEMVHRVVRTAHEKDALHIDCINNVLGHWLIRGPASTSSLDIHQAHEASATDSALEVYRQLRQNLVHAELETQHSSIAYGKRDQTHGAPRENKYGRSSQDDLGPLTWPDRDEIPCDHSPRCSSMPSQNDAVQTVLGIASLPLQATPDEITHALIIGSLTREGRFGDALSVFKDLVSTPARHTDNDSINGQIEANRNVQEAEEAKMRPTLSIFDSFFRGFSRHGRPSTATAFDAQDPDNTTWELAPSPEPSETEADSASVPQQQGQEGPHAQQRQMWRIETFQEIFDAFLNFEPDVSQVLESRVTRQGPGSKGEGGDRRVSTPYGWLTLKEKRRLDALLRAPSTNQLFWILTAIRRVSHDHAEWSLAMWQKVADKFDPHPARTSGKLAWAGFRLDNRLRRVLDHLEARMMQEQDASKAAAAEE